jgi:hypothetical protein
MNKTEKIFLVILALIFLVTIIIFGILKYSKIKAREKFEYGGFTYYIEDYGKLKFYHTKFYLPERNLTFNLYLRNDPKTNNVSLRVKGLKEIKPLTYIAIDQNFDDKNCTELTLASYSLSLFLATITNLESAVYYENYSFPTYKNLLVIKNINFSDENNVTLIILKYGDEEKVENINNTIIIQGVNCQILKASEKFILFVAERLRINKYIIPLE